MPDLFETFLKDTSGQITINLTGVSVAFWVFASCCACVQAAEALKQSKVTSVELTQACAKQMARTKKFNAYITETVEQALSKAQEYDNKRKHGPYEKTIRIPIFSIPSFFPLTSCCVCFVQVSLLASLAAFRSLLRITFVLKESKLRQLAKCWTRTFLRTTQL